MQPNKMSYNSFGWDKYHNLTVIYNWLDQLLEKYPEVLRNYNYGTSYENRTLRAVKVSFKQVFNYSNCYKCLHIGPITVLSTLHRATQ